MAATRIPVTQHVLQGGLSGARAKITKHLHAIPVFLGGVPCIVCLVGHGLNRPPFDKAITLRRRISLVVTIAS